MGTSVSPCREGRVQILKVHVRGKPVAADVDLVDLANEVGPTAEHHVIHTPHHATTRHAMACHAMPRHGTSCHIIPRHATSCHVMSCRAMSSKSPPRYCHVTRRVSNNPL